MGWTDELAGWLTGSERLVILGIGNPLKGDDGLGPRIIELLSGRVPERAKLLDCGSSPENFTGLIRRLNPTHVLMVDAARLGARPGAARLVRVERIKGLTVSTHTLPLSVLARYLQETVGARVALLGVQPADVGYGRGLTPEVERATASIASGISSVLARVYGGRPGS